MRTISISCPGHCRIWAGKLAKDRAHHPHHCPGCSEIWEGKLAEDRAQLSRALPDLSSERQSASVPRPLPDLGMEAGQRQSASSASVAQAAAGFGKGSWPKTERIISISYSENGCWIWVGKLAKDRAHHQHQLPGPLPDLGREAGQKQSASSASVAQAAARFGREAGRRQSTSSASVAQAAAGFRQGSWPKTERIISISCTGCCRIWVGKLAKDMTHHQHQLPGQQRDLGREAGRRQSTSSASVAQAAARFRQGS